MQWRTPPGFMDVYILHSLSKVAARSSAGSYCRSWHADIWTLITDPDMSTYEVACTHKNIRNTANCPSFVRTRATTATIVLRAAKDMTGSGVFMRDEWALRSDTILNQHIVPANSWQSCHILLWNPLSILLTRHRRDCEWTIEGSKNRRSNEKVRRCDLW